MEEIWITSWSRKFCHTKNNNFSIWLTYGFLHPTWPIHMLSSSINRPATKSEVRALVVCFWTWYESSRVSTLDGQPTLLSESSENFSSLKFQLWYTDLVSYHWWLVKGENSAHLPNRGFCQRLWEVNGSKLEIDLEVQIECFWSLLTPAVRMMLSVDKIFIA